MTLVWTLDDIPPTVPAGAAGRYDAVMADADQYDYELPPELIAQEPLADRAAARLLVVDRRGGGLAHRHVRDLPEILRPGDLVVVNDTRVVPARLVGRRERTGGRWEGLFLRVVPRGDAAGGDPAAAGAWQILAQTRGTPAVGERVILVDRDGADASGLTLVGRGAGGSWLVVPDGADPAAPEAVLARVGRVPLPGYIRGGAELPGDADRYQTVFAHADGSAAAPTAGLHFTPDLLAALAARGIDRATVTLHVGLDTFRPIAATRLEDHPMHTEWCSCPPETVAAVERARQRGGRVVAVGTTSTRTLETVGRSGTLRASSGPTDLFIRPGFRFHVVDCLLTNFHMPRTTLMVLVATFASRETILRAYAAAIRERYRFLSYGDAMLIA
jgi:S-adenosylmethionine:tRNA ribosyltransferase-isomerase